MDAFLRSHGAGWEWDESEQAALDAACASATRAEQLKVLFEAELASESPRATSLTRLPSEIRHHERAVVDLVGLLTLGAEPKRSPRHVRAARARWDRRRKANEARVGPRPVSVVQ
jgi:Ni,Fe-hydrogenase III component G